MIYRGKMFKFTALSAKVHVRGGHLSILALYRQFLLKTLAAGRNSSPALGRLWITPYCYSTANRFFRFRRFPQLNRHLPAFFCHQLATDRHLQSDYFPRRYPHRRQ